MNLLDPINCCLIMSSGAGAASDEHFERMMASGQELKEAMFQQRKNGVIISFAALDSPRPNATWRKRFAESLAVPCRYKTFTAVVTTSMIVRGVMKTMSWITPPAPNNPLKGFATFDEAEQWLETCRGEKIPALRLLLQQAQRTNLANLG